MYVHFHAFSGRRTIPQSTEIPKAMHIQNVAAHPTFPETLTAASSSALRPSVCLQLRRRNTSLTSQTVFFPLVFSLGGEERETEVRAPAPTQGEKEKIK